MKFGNLLRIVVNGALWAVVYNVVWGIAWFTFMREEWLKAFNSIGQPMPWTGDVWLVWVMFTLPIGVAIMARANTRTHSPIRSSINLAVAVWVLLVSGMAIWCIHVSLPIQVIVLDSSVNLTSMVAAALVGGWSLGLEYTHAAT